ncbi:MAG: anion:sodium symporter, partial [Gemmatimonadetes bacterium]|nr:anion:sodium symporter [Gemmatimonadota bacterium]
MSNKKVLTALLALAVVVVIVALPTPPPIAKADGTVVELTHSGKAALGVLVMAVLLWVTETFAFPVTGLIAVAALPIAGAGEFKSVVKEGFGHEIVLFCIGVMIFSTAISRTGLLRRFTTLLLARIGHSPKMIILAFLTVGAAASMWISDMAVAAILMPIGVGILEDANLKKLESNFGRALMISCAWGALIGGIGTPAGCGPNPVTIGYLEELAGIHF